MTRRPLVLRLLAGWSMLALALPLPVLAAPSTIVADSAPQAVPPTGSAHPVIPFSALADPGDEQGASICAAGDINGDGLSDLLISSPGHATGRGLVQTYLGVAGGGFTLNASLTSALLNGRFGESVSTAGDVNNDGYDDIIVGWPFSNSNAGSALVYAGGPSGITGGPIATLNGNLVGGQFGACVAYAGHLNNDSFGDVAVGAPLATSGTQPSESGAVYVYYGNGTSLNPAPTLIRGTALHQRRGTSVAGVGDVNADTYDDLLVGAPSTTTDGAIGKVLLYRGSSTGISPIANVDSVNGSTANARFGFSVCSAGDWDGDGYMDVAVGAPYAGPVVEGGAAFLIKGTSAGLSATVTSLKSGAQAASHLGWSVGCAGDVNGDGMGDVIIGEPDFDGAIGADEGRIHVRYGLRAGTALSDWIEGGSGVPGAKMGKSVSGLGDATGDGFGDFAVGLPGYGASAGTVYVFSGGVATGGRLSSFIYGHPVANARVGQSVSSGGDFNGDGFDDAIIGVPNDQWSLGATEGAAWIAWGAAGVGTGATLILILDGPQALSQFGASVALAGDVDGDGYDDALVGAPAYTGAQSGQGGAFLYKGQAAGLDTIPATTWLGSSAGQAWGASVGGAGDLNHDGYADVAIASPSDGSQGPAHAGRVAIYLGGPGGPSTSPAFEVFGQTAGESLGVAIEPAGDVTGDGVDDLAIGAPGDASGEGRVRIVRGQIGGPPFHVQTLASPFGAGAHFGASIAGRGDADGDGIADLAVGAPHALISGSAVGAVAIFRGAIGGPATPSAQSFFGAAAGDELGSGVSFGDLNSDGRSDLAIGIPGADLPVATAGAVDLYLADPFGNFSNPPTRLSRTTAVVQGRGASIAADADMNGDGFADVITGAPISNTFATGGGAVEFAMGGGSLSARDHVERQLQWLTSTPLALGARSNTGDSFDTVMRARSAVGREEMTVQNQRGTTTQPWSSLPILPSVVVTPGPPDPTNGSFSDMGQGMNGFAGGDLAKWRMRVRTRFPWIPSTPWWSPSGVAQTQKHVLMPPSLVAVGPGATNFPAATLELAPAAPNPSRAGVTFVARLPETGRVDLAIYDVRGRLVRDLSPGLRAAGETHVVWDGTDASGHAVHAGLYFARLAEGAHTVSRGFVRL